jgi:hypothetical protein
MLNLLLTPQSLAFTGKHGCEAADIKWLFARGLCLLMVMLSALLLPRPVEAGAFIFAGDSAPNRILHPKGYTGSQDSLFVEVCIDPTSLVPSGAALTDVEQSVINNISTWNQLQSGVGNSLLVGTIISPMAGLILSRLRCMKWGIVLAWHMSTRPRNQVCQAVTGTTPRLHQGYTRW